MKDLSKALLKYVPDYRKSSRLKDYGFDFPTVFIWAWDHKSPAHKPFLTTRLKALYSSNSGEEWSILCGAPMVVEMVEWMTQGLRDEFWERRSMNVNECADNLYKSLKKK